MRAWPDKGIETDNRKVIREMAAFYLFSYNLQINDGK